MLKLGDKFESYETFDSKLKEYEKIVLCNYWMRDCRTLKNQSRKFPNGVAARAPSQLKYYHFRMACIKGGRNHVSKSTKRQRLTFKQGCEAGMFLKLSSCGNYVEIVKIKEDHNHSVSKILFETLPHQRLNLPAEIKATCQEIVRVRGNKKIAQLKDLPNPKNKNNCSNNFSQCIKILQNEYKCAVKILCDKKDNLLCLFFQNVEMKKTFDAYPEIIFVDWTHCLLKSRAATYLIMVEDSEGNGVVVAAGILLTVNEETIDWFVKQFKESNTNAVKVKVIMSAKDGNERSAFKKNFPNASIQIGLFHTLQTFNREVNQKKMNLTEEECETSKRILMNLAHATSEDRYEEEYQNLKASAPKIVIDYYEKNWHQIKDEWVLYLSFNNQSFFNRRNNKLENVNQKLNSVISRFSNLEEFIENFFKCLNSMRINRNVKNVMRMNKVSTNSAPAGSVEHSFKQLLSNYAFEKVQNQINLIEKCKDLIIIEDDKCLAPCSEGLLEVTSKSCECLFWKSIQLPCQHILKFRSMFDLPLYDESLCLRRWTRNYFEEQQPFWNKMEDSECVDLVITNTGNQGDKIAKRRTLPTHAKLKLMRDECVKMQKICSEVSTTVFYKRLEIVKNHVEKWLSSDDENNYYNEPGLPVPGHPDHDYCLTEQDLNKIKWPDVKFEGGRRKGLGQSVIRLKRKKE